MGPSVTAEQAHQDGGGVAAERVRQTSPRALDLSAAGLAAELRDDLADLGGSGGADRMPFRLQTAGGIHRHLAAEAGPALLRREPAGARLEEPEPLGGDDLRDREAVVQLDDVDVFGALARLPVGG